MERDAQTAPADGRLQTSPPALPATAGTAADSDASTLLWRRPMLALLLFVLTVAATGSLLYTLAKRSTTQAAHNNLEAIARLKSAEIAFWLDEHVKDTELAVNTPHLTADLKQWQDGGRPPGTVRLRLLDQIQRITANGRYREVGIRSANDGALLLTSSHRADSAADRAEALKAASTMTPVLSDKNFVADDAADIGLDFYVPIRLPGSPTALGVLAIRDSPNDFLFPLLGHWPGASPSAQTVVFRIDGANLVYLKNPNRGGNATHRLRLPLSSPTLLAAQAARGKLGPLVGTDFRGQPVLGYAQLVAGTSWIVIAKVDAAEAYDQLNTIATGIATTAIALLLLAARWIVLHGRHAAALQRQRMERTLLIRRLEFLSSHANDTLILTAPNGTIAEVNERSAATYGYRRDELIGTNIAALQAPSASSALEETPCAPAPTDGDSISYETVNFRRNGESFAVEISSRRIDVDGTAYLQWIVRDITERKAALARIERLSRIKAAILSANRAIIHHRSPADVYRAVCQACVDHGGFWLVWVGLVNQAAQRIEPIEVNGPTAPYLDGIVISTRHDLPEGRGPTAIAHREQRIHVCNDLAAESTMAPWRQRALAFGLASSIALPMQRGGQPFGTLSAYGPEKNYFDSETVGLLRDMAKNISFAIDQFDRDEQRRQAENALRQSEEKFRTLVEHLPQNVFVKDTRLAFVSCNATYARRLGILPEQIVGKTDRDFYPAALADKYERDSRRVMELGEVVSVQESCMIDGRERYFETFKAPVRNALGETVGLLGAFWDITESKRTERALRQYADEIEDLYQNAPCGYHTVDAFGMVTRINDTELRWLGYKREEIVGRTSIVELLSPSTRHSFAENFPRFTTSGAVQYLELDMMRKDGSLLPVILCATAQFDAAGRYVASRNTVHDITDRRRQEQDRLSQAKRFRDLSHRLVAVQEDERRRLAGELHDRASPNLAAIKITLATLSGMLPDAAPDAIDACLDDTRALLDDTTAGIREICADLRPTALDYAGLIPALESYAAQFMKRTAVAVRLKTPTTEIRLGTEIESALFRIAQEALTNCAKHAFAKVIDIDLDIARSGTTLRIADDGFGFDAEALTQSGGIAGLGLITMKERAEFVGGRFLVASTPLTGTEIRVELDYGNAAEHNRPPRPGSDGDSHAAPTEPATQERPDRFATTLHATATGG